MSQDKSDTHTHTISEIMFQNLYRGSEIKDQVLKSFRKKKLKNSLCISFELVFDRSFFWLQYNSSRKSKSAPILNCLADQVHTMSEYEPMNGTFSGQNDSRL